MLEGLSNYPLTWPVGWPRTASYKRHRSRFDDPSMAKSAKAVLDEIRLLGARSTIISTNVQLRLDGLPKSNQRRVDDPGVAVYFVLKGKPKVLACDCWSTPEENLWAIGNHIAAIRGQQRWGVGTIDQAFSGYAALPTPQIGWWIVLGIPREATYSEVLAAYRNLAKVHHPDAGGNPETFLKIQAAWDDARKERKWQHET